MSRSLLGVLVVLLSGPRVGSLRGHSSGAAHLASLRRAPSPRVAPPGSRVLLQVDTQIPEGRASRTVTNDDEESVLHELRDLRQDQFAAKLSPERHGQSEDSLDSSGSWLEGGAASQQQAFQRCPFGMPARWKQTLDKDRCELEYEAGLYSAYRVGTLEGASYKSGLVLRFPAQSAPSEHAFGRMLGVLRAFRGGKSSEYFAQIRGYVEGNDEKDLPHLIWLQAQDLTFSSVTSADLIAEATWIVPELVCGLRLAHRAGWVHGGITEESIGVFALGRDYRTFKFVEYGDLLCKPGSAEFPCEYFSLDYAAPEIWEELQATGSYFEAKKKLTPASDLYSLGWTILMSFGSPEASRVFSSIQEKISVIAEAARARDLIKVIRTAASARHLLVELNASRSSDPVFDALGADAKAALMRMTALDPVDRASADDVLRDMYRAIGRIFSLWMWVMSISWCH